jgi:glucan biosynthesis protein C
MVTSENRYAYLDNIRNILVYNVVVVHAIVMFTYPLGFWWPVIDIKGSSRVYETLLMTMDIYLMPVLIFIAALFIFPSLNARSAPGYIKKRFTRLFVPVIVFAFCAGDILHQILITRLDGVSPGYLRTFMDYWRDFIPSGVITYVGIVKGKMMNEMSFSLQHTWFLSFLFFMTLIIVLLSLPFRKRREKQIVIDTRKKIIFKTILFAVISGFIFFMLAIWCTLNGIEPSSWVRVFALIQVRINQFWILLPLFLFGLYVYRKEWLTRGDIGSWKMWGALSLVFLSIYVILIYNQALPLIDEILKVYEHNVTFTDKIPLPSIPESFKLVYTIINIILFPVCIFLLMFFLSFAKKFFNRPNTVTAFCSKHSINVYILHLIPVILLQYSFMNIPVPPIVKVIAIIIIVIPACLWLSHRLVYPYPLAAISLFAALKLVSLYMGFDFYYKALLGILFISFAGALFEAGRLVIAGRGKESGLTPKGDEMKQ